MEAHDAINAHAPDIDTKTVLTSSLLPFSGEAEGMPSGEVQVVEVSPQVSRETHHTFATPRAFGVGWREPRR